MKHMVLIICLLVPGCYYDTDLRTYPVVDGEVLGPDYRCKFGVLYEAGTSRNDMYAGVDGKPVRCHNVSMTLKEYCETPRSAGESYFGCHNFKPN